MERSRQHIEELIAAYVSGEATTEERNRLERLYARAIQKKAYVDDLETGQIIVLKQEGFIKLLDEIHREPPKKLGLWSRAVHGSVVWKIAAAVAAITLGVWLYYSSSLSSLSSRVSRDLVANDIAPGKNTATLTLDNGEVVDLNDKELDISSATVEPLKEGSEVAPETPQFLASRIAKSKTVVLSTPRGGQYQVVLPDGTRVWLNADSKLSFPSQFSGRERKVLLEGEGYFEVAKLTRSSLRGLSAPSLRGTEATEPFASSTKLISSNHERVPFIVETVGSGSRSGQRVEVLGTHFNINSYADESSIKTTLLEGSVKINDATTLKPNQQAVLQGGALIVKEIDPATEIDWKQGEFVFKNEDFKTAMRRIARWYDVEIVYQNEKPITLDPRGWVSRSSNISSVLKMIESTGDVHFKIEGRRIIVTN